MNGNSRPATRVDKSADARAEIAMLARAQAQKVKLPPMTSAGLYLTRDEMEVFYPQFFERAVDEVWYPPHTSDAAGGRGYLAVVIPDEDEFLVHIRKRKN